MHFALERVEISFQDLWLVFVLELAQMEFLTSAALLQGNCCGGFGVADPLGSSARSDQVTLALQFQKIDWSGEELDRFASSNLKKIDMRGPQPETDNESERAVEEFLNGARFAEGGERGIHGLIIEAKLRDVLRAWIYGTFTGPSLRSR